MRKNKIIILASFLLWIAGANLASAAYFYFDKQTEGNYVGDIFDLDVKINTESQNINAFEFKLNFPKDKLELMQLAGENSITAIYVAPPKIDNNLGTMAMTGGIPNGVVSESGSVVKLKFKVKQAGIARLSVDGGSQILLNDGKGTNVFRPYESLALNLLPVQEATSGLGLWPIVSWPATFIGLVALTLIFGSFLVKARNRYHHYKQALEEDSHDLLVEHLTQFRDKHGLISSFAIMIALSVLWPNSASAFWLSQPLQALEVVCLALLFLNIMLLILSGAYYLLSKRLEVKHELKNEQKNNSLKASFEILRKQIEEKYEEVLAAEKTSPDLCDREKIAEIKKDLDDIAKLTVNI